MRRRSRSPRSDVVREASAWFVDLEDDPQDPALRARFDEWLRHSPEHVRAFLQITQHWEEGRRPLRPTVESIQALQEIARREPANLVSLPAVMLPGSRHADKPVRSPGLRRSLVYAIAASMLLVVGLSGLLWRQFVRGVYTTGVGEQRSLTLSDGSTVELNSRSSLRVRFNDTRRLIELLQGQALFRVARNARAPFIVQTATTRVRALGTQFDVYQTQTGTIVTVVDGRVAASGSSSLTSVRPGRGSDEVIVNAGEQVSIRPQQDVTAPIAPTVQPANVELAIAWTQHRLIFRGTPLRDVVHEFNRYSGRPLVIKGREISSAQVSGSFSSSDPADLLRFLHEVGGYEVRETASSIEISPRE